MARIAVLLGDRFEFVGDGGIDERKRLSLTKALDALRPLLGKEPEMGLRFSIYANEAGQILLSPEIPVPLHEVWLYKNPEALARVQRGISQAAEGKLHDLGSFDQYADDEIE
jgi:hypothetical protein